MEQNIDLLKTVEETLYTAVLSDALDELGYREQAMRENLRPVYPGARFAGFALTISCMDSLSVPENPYEKEIEAVDALRPGSVAVVSTGQSSENAPWGELLSTAATARGARGAIVDGLVRDIEMMRGIPFPVFAAGMKPVDSKGRGIVTGYNVPIECGGVVVSPGDLVFADSDGVIVVPSSVVDEAVRRATEKVSKENLTREELRNGAFLRDVYARYGVL